MLLRLVRCGSAQRSQFGRSRVALRACASASALRCPPPASASHSSGSSGSTPPLRPRRSCFLPPLLLLSLLSVPSSCSAELRDRRRLALAWRSLVCCLSSSASSFCCSPPQVSSPPPPLSLCMNASALMLLHDLPPFATLSFICVPCTTLLGNASIFRTIRSYAVRSHLIGHQLFHLPLLF